MANSEDDRRPDGATDKAQEATGEKRPCGNLDALRRKESGYREVLSVEPSDMAVRVELAWCLFAQCLYLTGKESALPPTEPATAYEDQPERRSPRSYRHALRTGTDMQTGAGAMMQPSALAPDPTMQTADVAELLSDCGRQITIVTQLSRDARDRAAMTSLTAWVKLAFGARALVQFQDAGARIVKQLSHDIINPSASTL
jgi:hypothetical protein